MLSGVLMGVPDVMLQHRGEGGTKAGGYLFVEAIDPKAALSPAEKKEALAYWGRADQVGLLVLQFRPRKRMFARDVRLLPSYQRQQLARRMYRYAQQVTGRTAVPAHDQTDAGKAMWASFRREDALKRSW